MDTSKVETELANCRAVYEKYKSELWTGAQDPKKLIPKILEELGSRLGHDSVQRHRHR